MRIENIFSAWGRPAPCVAAGLDKPARSHGSPWSTILVNISYTWLNGCNTSKPENQLPAWGRPARSIAAGLDQPARSHGSPFWSVPYQTLLDEAQTRVQPSKPSSNLKTSNPKTSKPYYLDPALKGGTPDLRSFGPFRIKLCADLVRSVSNFAQRSPNPCPAFKTELKPQNLEPQNLKP